MICYCAAIWQVKWQRCRHFCGLNEGRKRERAERGKRRGEKTGLYRWAAQSINRSRQYIKRWNQTDINCALKCPRWCVGWWPKGEADGVLKTVNWQTQSPSPTPTPNAIHQWQHVYASTLLLLLLAVGSAVMQDMVEYNPYDIYYIDDTYCKLKLLHIVR